jgi:hypothetical protein
MSYDTGPMREKLAKATPGMWQTHGAMLGYKGDIFVPTAKMVTDCHHIARLFADKPDKPIICELQALQMQASSIAQIEANAALIVAAKNDMPTMLDTIDTIAAQAAEIARLRRILHRYGDRVPMAMCHRPDWQQSIDDAMQWVADNPEASRDQIATDSSEPFGRESTIRPGFFEDDMP